MSRVSLHKYYLGFEPDKLTYYVYLPNLYKLTFYVYLTLKYIIFFLFSGNNPLTPQLRMYLPISLKLKIILARFLVLLSETRVGNGVSSLLQILRREYLCRYFTLFYFLKRDKNALFKILEFIKVIL